MFVKALFFKKNPCHFDTIRYQSFEHFFFLSTEKGSFSKLGVQQKTIGETSVLLPLAETSDGLFGRRPSHDSTSSSCDSLTSWNVFLNVSGTSRLSWSIVSIFNLKPLVSSNRSFLWYVSWKCRKEEIHSDFSFDFTWDNI